MRCPICGAKMMNKQLCPYCKVIDKQVYGASNKKVKQMRKTDNKDLIVYTSVVPSDVSKVGLWLFTIFLGWCGVNHFIINRPVRAWYAVLSCISSFIMTFVNLLAVPKTLFGEWSIYFIHYAALMCMAINVVMWVFDMISLLFKGFKIPVVLPDKGDVN